MFNPIIKKYALKQKTPLLIGSISILLVDILNVCVPLILQQAIDAIEFKENFQVLFSWVALYCVVGSLIAIGRYFWRKYLVTVGIGTEAGLRAELTNSLFQDESREKSSSEEKSKEKNVLALINSDVMAVRSVFEGGVIVLLDSSIAIFLSPIAMYFIAPNLTFWLLIPILFIPLLSVLNERTIRNRYKLLQEAFQSLLSKTRENLRGVRTIKALAKISYFEHLFFDRLKIYIERNLSLSRIESLLIPSFDLCITASMLILVWFGGLEVINGTLSIGGFIALQRYISQLRWPAQALGLAFTVFQKAQVSAERINKILNRSTDSASLMLKSVDTSDKTSVRVSNLCYSYNNSLKPSLDGITFEIKAGETLAIIGDVASGKSTLAKILSGSLLRYTGTYSFFGVDIKNLSLTDLRKNIRYVPQDTFLFNNSIENNLLLGWNENPEKINQSEDLLENPARSAEIYQEINEFPEKFKTLLGEKGITVSGGQRQRLTIARAIVEQPLLYIFDDTLSAVDIATESKILKNLSRNNNTNATRIFITHRLSTVRACEKILILNGGKFHAYGSHDELIKDSPWFQNFVRIQELHDELARYSSSR
jgi:ATP-binding cassette, subfamily B, multidrug efflux pump